MLFPRSNSYSSEHQVRLIRTPIWFHEINNIFKNLLKVDVQQIPILNEHKMRKQPFFVTSSLSNYTNYCKYSKKIQKLVSTCDSWEFLCTVLLTLVCDIHTMLDLLWASKCKNIHAKKFQVTLCNVCLSTWLNATRSFDLENIQMNVNCTMAAYLN